MKQQDRIQIAHGAGGEMMQQLIRNTILSHLDLESAFTMDDAAELLVEQERMAFTTDSFVVKPIFFPGGDIGSLAVSGTVNDLLMKGAKPLALSLGLILEEGLLMADLERILTSIKQTCETAGVRIKTGDTKVVGKGEADKIFINTAGVGAILPGVNISGDRAQAGDKVIVSGAIGRHGVAIMAKRNGLDLKKDILSDAMPLNREVLPLLEAFPNKIKVLRDPTRGGLAATLNEIARASQKTILIHESKTPLDREVVGICDLLGFDPYLLPCEGRFLAIVAPHGAEAVLKALPNGVEVGEVMEGEPLVLLRTSAGGERRLDPPVGELLPRIC